MRRIDPVFDRDKFLLRQKHLAIAEKYYVWDEQENPLLYVERPRHMFLNLLAIFGGFFAGVIVFIVLFMLASVVSVEPFQRFILYILAGIGAAASSFIVAIALQKKRHVVFYRDDTKQERLLEVIQDKKLQLPNASYTVNDVNGQILAMLRKNYFYNIFRKRWYCYASDGMMLCVAKEDSIIRSLLRRFLGNLFGLLRTNFIILKGEEENLVGEFNRKFTIFDRYVLDMSADPLRFMDRRIALALSVMLDTGERR